MTTPDAVNMESTAPSSTDSPPPYEETAPTSLASVTTAPVLTIAASPTRLPPRPPLSLSTELPPAATQTPPPPLVIPTASPQVTAFLARNSLPPSARSVCWAFVAAHFPASSLHECPSQGYCSYTLLVPSAERVIQFRPAAHQLNVTLALLAREIYGVLAPETRFLGVLPVPYPSDDNPRKNRRPALLYVYAMTVVPGISLTDFRRSIACRSSGYDVKLQRAILVRDFARFLARGWEARQDREVIPFRSTSRLGGSLRLRLEMMRDRLPARFRATVVDVLDDLEGIEALPWVLTHGDVVGDNIMVEPPPAGGGGDGNTRGTTGWRQGTMRGMLDWAEAEYLPFGVGMYGVEEMLGQCVRAWDGEAWGGRFAYYPEAGDLRRLFWAELEGAVPVLRTDKGVRRRVEQAGRLGILLWRGFAFDDGRIDRVVQEGRDDGEVQRLDMFLFGTDHPEMEGDGQVGKRREKRRQQGDIKKPLVTVANAEDEEPVPKGGFTLIRRMSSKIM